METGGSQTFIWLGDWRGSLKSATITTCVFNCFEQEKYSGNCNGFMENNVIYRLLYSLSVTPLQLAMLPVQCSQAEGGRGCWLRKATPFFPGSFDGQQASVCLGCLCNLELQLIFFIFRLCLKLTTGPLCWLGIWSLCLQSHTSFIGGSWEP